MRRDLHLHGPAAHLNQPLQAHRRHLQQRGDVHILWLQPHEHGASRLLRCGEREAGPDTRGQVPVDRDQRGKWQRQDRGCKVYTVLPGQECVLFVLIIFLFFWRCWRGGAQGGGASRSTSCRRIRSRRRSAMQRRCATRTARDLESLSGFGLGMGVPRCIPPSSTTTCWKNLG